MPTLKSQAAGLETKNRDFFLGQSQLGIHKILVQSKHSPRSYQFRMSTPRIQPRLLFLLYLILQILPQSPNIEHPCALKTKQ